MLRLVRTLHVRRGGPRRQARTLDEIHLPKQSCVSSCNCSASEDSGCILRSQRGSGSVAGSAVRLVGLAIGSGSTPPPITDTMSQVDPLLSARRQLSHAESALEDLRHASQVGMTYAWRHAWERFVNHLEKAWVRTYAVVKKHGKGFQQWAKPYDKLREDDPLLKYLCWARNAEEHADSTLRPGAPQNLRVERSPNDPLYHTRGPVLPKNAAGKTVVPHGTSIVLRVDPPTRYDLAPVEDRRKPEKRLDPPSNHLGRTLRSHDPVVVAELGLKFYRGVLKHAQDVISKGS